MNNNKITNLLVQEKHEKAFSRLYKNFPKVEAYVQQNSGSKAEALDIFQEGLILLYKKVKTEPTIQAEGFLIKSCKYLWQNELRKKKVRRGDSEKLEVFIQSDNELEILIEKETKLIQVEKIVSQISKKCREIFEMFYFKSMRMTEIAKKIGYKSVQSAKVQKYKCMEHARNLALANTEQNVNLKN
ncbi:MAG: RNA polymerase sigma factor [Putridiphycobacter sp.]